MPERKRISRRAFVGGGLLLASGLALDSYAFAPKRLRLERVSVEIDDLGSEFEGYKIALLSDFHLPFKANEELVREAIRMAQAERPDLIAFTGDFVHGKDISRMPSFKGVFDNAHAPDGVVAVLGNHDHWFDAEAVRRELLDNTPCELIENRGRLLIRGSSALAIGGIGDLWEGFVVPRKAFLDVDPSVPRILLSHNPDFAEDMTAAVRVDLQLSGHTHGGEVRLPFAGAPVVPSKYGNKFREGLCQGRRHRVYVTRGVGTVCARLLAPPEVTVITLRSRLKVLGH